MEQVQRTQGTANSASPPFSQAGLRALRHCQPACVPAAQLVWRDTLGVTVALARHSRKWRRALGGSGGEHVAAAKISVAALRRRSPRTARRARSCHVVVAEVARLAQPRLARGPATRARARVACPGRAAAANRASRSG